MMWQQERSSWTGATTTCGTTRMNRSYSYDDGKFCHNQRSSWTWNLSMEYESQTINHKWNNRHIEIVSYKDNDNDNDKGRGRSIHLSSSIIRENGDGLPGKYIMDIESCRISRPSLSGDPIYIYDFPQKLIKLFNQWSIQETRILSRILSPYMARNMMDDTWIIIWRY